jgi:protein-disulfide isomerase
MKKLLLIGAICLFSLMGAAAQRPGDRQPKTPEQRAQAQTRHLSKQLALSPDQQAKVQSVLVEKTTQMEAVRTDGTLGKTDRMQRMKALKAETDSAMQITLTPDQYQRYLQMQQERRDKTRRRQ